MAGAFVASMLSTGSVGAQRVSASVDLDGSRLRYADTVDANATGITPSLRIDWNRATLSAYGTYAQLASAWSADGSSSLSLFTPNKRGWYGELAGTLGGSTHEDGTRTAAATAMGRLHLDGTSSGAWLGAGGGTTSDGFVWRAIRQGEAGVWVANGPASLTLSAVPTAVDDTIRYTDLSAEGAWNSGRLELDVVIGGRAGARLPSIASNATTWGSASAVVWIFPRVALVGSGGTYPVDYTQGFPGGRFVSLGLRLALTRRGSASDSATAVEPASPPAASGPAASGAAGITDFHVERSSAGIQVIRVRATSARQVEMMGDLTGWKARRLAAAGGGWYSLAVPANPGSYQLVLRIDGGEWTPPPGVPTVRDEFGGTTGVVVIQ